MALEGSTDRAESVFVTVLSRSRKDPSALTNLGNLHLMRGELETALVFYSQALTRDSTDAGIRLNRAIAFLLAGDEPSAYEEAARAVAMAGSPDSAQSLLGLRREEMPPRPGNSSETRSSRGQEAWLSHTEIRELLQLAATMVPDRPTPPPESADSTQTGQREQPDRSPKLRTGAPRAQAPDSASNVGHVRVCSPSDPPTWRTGGPRAVDRTPLAGMLYWKHWNAE
jgi:tetratricopeptide (TPR) repeat protein